MFFRLLFVSVLIVMKVLVAANPNDTTERFCGTHLTNTLALYCRGKYESMMDTKKRGLSLINVKQISVFIDSS